MLFASGRRYAAIVHSDPRASLRVDTRVCPRSPQPVEKGEAQVESTQPPRFQHARPLVSARPSVVLCLSLVCDQPLTGPRATRFGG